MATGKNIVRRKKRTSKHVLKANEDRQKALKDQDPVQEPNPVGDAKARPEKKKKSKKEKDPLAAAAYLSSWKHREAGGAWKFNKNTQSWLFRHMYEVEKVPKVTFTLLMEYLAGLQGSTRSRVAEDAKRRALRYKEYEKSLPQGEKEDGDQADAPESSPIPTEENDAKRWERISDHDKRKEYKRARKVLEIMEGTSSDATGL